MAARDDRAAYMREWRSRDSPVQDRRRAKARVQKQADAELRRRHALEYWDIYWELLPKEENQ
jgi:hypothetical protein